MHTSIEQHRGLVSSPFRQSFCTCQTGLTFVSPKFLFAEGPLELPAPIADKAPPSARSIRVTRSSKIEIGAGGIPLKSDAAVDTEPIESRLRIFGWRALASLSPRHRLGEAACTSNLQAVTASKEIQGGSGAL